MQATCQIHTLQKALETQIVYMVIGGVVTDHTTCNWQRAKSVEYVLGHQMIQYMNGIG